VTILMPGARMETPTWAAFTAGAAVAKVRAARAKVISLFTAKLP
jgi:hypothetical protein